MEVAPAFYHRHQKELASVPGRDEGLLVSARLTSSVFANQLEMAAQGAQAAGTMEFLWTHHNYDRMD